MGTSEQRENYDKAPEYSRVGPERREKGEPLSIALKALFGEQFSKKQTLQHGTYPEK